MRYSCGHVSTKKNVRGIKDAAASTPPQLRSSRYIRYRDNIGYPRYGERYDIGDNQYSSNNLSYCPINRFLESISNLNLGCLLLLLVILTIRVRCDRTKPIARRQETCTLWWLPPVLVAGFRALSGQMPLFTTIVTRHFCAGQQRVKRAPHLGRLSGIIGR